MIRKHSAIQNFIRAFALAILAYFAVMFFFTAGASFLSDEVIRNAFLGMVTVMPFGSQIASFTLSLISGTLNYSGDLTPYKTIVSLLTPVSFWEDTLKILTIAISSKIVSAAILTILGIFGNNPKPNMFVRAICNIVATLVCTFSASCLMQMWYNWLNIHPIHFQSFVLAILSLVGVGGTIAYPVIFLGMTFLGSLAWVAVTIILSNIAKVVVTYSATLIFLVYLNAQAIVKLAAVIPVWAIIMAVIVFVETRFDR